MRRDLQPYRKALATYAFYKALSARLDVAVEIALRASGFSCRGAMVPRFMHRPNWAEAQSSAVPGIPMTRLDSTSLRIREGYSCSQHYLSRRCVVRSIVWLLSILAR